MIIRFTILGECCSMKNARQLVHFGKKPAFIKSAKAREYERSAGLQIPSSARQMLSGPVRVTLHLFYASERPDLDGALLLDILAAKYKRQKGALKSLGDGQYAYAEGERVLVSRGVFENDRQCREIHLYHHIDRTNPRAEIEIEPMLPQQAALIQEELPAIRPPVSPAAQSEVNPF